jgi:hypothetical protein
MLVGFSYSCAIPASAPQLTDIPDTSLLLDGATSNSSAGVDASLDPRLHNLTTITITASANAARAAATPAISPTLSFSAAPNAESVVAASERFTGGGAGGLEADVPAGVNRTFVPRNVPDDAPRAECSRCRSERLAKREATNAADSMSSDAVEPNAPDAGTASDPWRRNVPRRNAVTAPPELAEKVPVSANRCDDVKLQLVENAADGTSGCETLTSEGATSSEASQSASDGAAAALLSDRAEAIGRELGAKGAD